MYIEFCLENPKQIVCSLGQLSFTEWSLNEYPCPQTNPTSSPTYSLSNQNFCMLIC